MTRDEACALLAEDDGARVIAGGQTLVPMMAMRLARPTRLIDIARIARASGHQYIFIDGQHGVFNAETICNLANAALEIGVAPLARVKSLNDPETPVLLDNGVSGIIFPDINTPEEAERAVAICRYPPIGRRSVGANFPQFDARAVPASVAVPAINASTVVVVMVETGRAAAWSPWRTWRTTRAAAPFS